MSAWERQETHPELLTENSGGNRRLENQM